MKFNNPQFFVSHCLDYAYSTFQYSVLVQDSLLKKKDDKNE
jgi:hypothetical protein